jgi:hypothetical protein
MKRLMVTLAIVCSSVYMFASELIVKGKIDAPFSVYVNGEKYYSYKSKVDVSYLPSGRYNLEIYTEGAYSELLYDYTINIPRRSTVYATFTGDNKMYISTEKDAPATIIVDLTPYPHRYHKPVPVYHSTPKPAPKHHHHAAPAPKPAPHHAALAPKPAPKPAPKAESAPRSNHKSAAPAAHSTTKAAPKSETKAVRTSTSSTNNNTKSTTNTTVRTSSSSNNAKTTSSTKTSSTRSTVNTRK